ncbi:hypothetical protein Kpho02_77680 [Kitasatospora phosalacinea]|uniref:Uncharacterized protein n=1 Tax=Kitasatospora phosalacinea TaxID=2065 RepID=A0A9W6QIC8_9ACTN|nr:hypothetical protein [Kitasatospora phosalacinea]GLW75471.1 hypothetical protein Kpho02_77680 [Kitasatospora phosalacinea]
MVERQAQQGEDVVGIGGQQRFAVGGVDDLAAAQQGDPVVAALVGLGPADEVTVVLEGVGGGAGVVAARLAEASLGERRRAEGEAREAGGKAGCDRGRGVGGA